MRGVEILTKKWQTLKPSYRRLGVSALIVLAVILGSIYWFYAVYSDTSRTFWAMVNNNLATPSVVKKTGQEAQNVSITSYTGLVFNGRPVLHSYRQITDSSTSPPSKLTLETIGTENADYQRYSYIKRPTQNGKELDYSEVYKIWLQASSSARPASQLGTNLFGAALFGNFNYAQRTELVNKLKTAYQPTFAGQSSVNGHRVYRYSVKVNMRNYAEAVKQYISMTGLQRSSVSPQSYDKDETVDIVMSVDARSRQLLSIDNSQNKGSKEEYLSYGIRTTALKPAKLYTVADLQKAIQAASQ